MSKLTDRESVILDDLWSNHVYFIDKSLSYSQPGIEWAIKESGNTLDRKHIQVRVSLDFCWKRLIYNEEYLTNRRRAGHCQTQENQIRDTADKSERIYISSLKKSLRIQFPPDLNFCPDISAPRKRVPRILCSLKRSLEDLVKRKEISEAILKGLADVLSEGKLFESDSLALSPPILNSNEISTQEQNGLEFMTTATTSQRIADTSANKALLKNVDKDSVSKPNGRITPSVFRSKFKLSESDYKNLQVSLIFIIV